MNEANDQMIRDDPRPLYERAQSVLIARIRNGVYKPGDKLPPEDQLGTSLGVSRVTIRTALSNLETLGYIRRIHGSGTFVSRQQFKIDAQLDTLESFHPRLAARVGRSSRISNLEIKEDLADREVAEAMGLRTGDPIISIKRIVLFDEVPVVYLQDFLTAAVCGCDVEVLKSDFESVVDFFDGSEGRSLIAWCESSFEAVRANEFLAGQLNTEKGDLLFQLDEIFYTGDNKLVSWSRNYILPEYFKFHIRRHVIHDLINTNSD